MDIRAEGWADDGARILSLANRLQFHVQVDRKVEPARILSAVFTNLQTEEGHEAVEAPELGLPPRPRTRKVQTTDGSTHEVPIEYEPMGDIRSLIGRRDRNIKQGKAIEAEEVASNA